MINTLFNRCIVITINHNYLFICYTILLQDMATFTTLYLKVVSVLGQDKCKKLYRHEHTHRVLIIERKCLM